MGLFKVGENFPWICYPTNGFVYQKTNILVRAEKKQELENYTKNISNMIYNRNERETNLRKFN